MAEWIAKDSIIELLGWYERAFAEADHIISAITTDVLKLPAIDDTEVCKGTEAYVYYDDAMLKR